MAPPPPYARVMEDMVKGREYATQLKALLRESPEASRLVDRILHAISLTIQTAKAAAAAAEEEEEEEASEVQSEVTCTGKRKAAGGAGKRAAACRRRAQPSSVVTKSVRDLEDGHAWRKYGQKEIQNCKHPKAYFRCTHKHDQQCAAQRQVQRRDDDPDAYTVTYIGAHTCRDPATAADDELHAGSRLISFAAANATTASTTTTTGNASNRQAGHKGAVLPAEPPRQLEGGGGGGEREQELELEEVLSSLTPAGSSAATAEAVRTATPGPDQGDVTSGLQLQQQQQQHWFGGGGLSGVAHLGYDDTFDLEDIVFGSITGGMYAAEY